jgi:hypothetical protein
MASIVLFLLMSLATSRPRAVLDITEVTARACPEEAGARNGQHFFAQLEAKRTAGLPWRKPRAGKELGSFLT